MRIKKYQQGGGYLLGASGGALALLAGLMLFPAIPTAVQAEEGNTTTTLSVEPAIAISLPNTIAFDLTPSADGVFASSTASLAVSTNNETGYSLYFSTTDTDNSLHGQNPATTETIVAVSGSTTEENFENNTWGYNLSLASAGDATTYEAVPTSRETALLTTEAPSNDNYNLTFGAKVSTAMPSGTYTNTVAVSVVANPKIISSLVDLTYMQDMTQEICAKSSENDTTRLIDSRDGKYYWVAKLKDGNCWMTQNLDLDLGVNNGRVNTTVLTPEDSDVSQNWDSSSAYPLQATELEGAISSNTSNTGTYSWDVGMYVKSDPTSDSDCDSVSSLADSSCISAGWTDVSSMTPMIDDTSNTVIAGGQYDAHYLVGNYYQWNAATAGTGGTITNDDAADSICPKGWHLPIDNYDIGSFYYLFNSYDAYVSPVILIQSPLYFSPYGRLTSGSLQFAGSLGLYWSSTTYSRVDAASCLYMGVTAFQPSSYRARADGLTIRCFAYGDIN